MNISLGVTKDKLKIIFIFLKKRVLMFYRPAKQASML